MNHTHDRLWQHAIMGVCQFIIDISVPAFAVRVDHDDVVSCCELVVSILLSKSRSTSITTMVDEVDMATLSLASVWSIDIAKVFECCLIPRPALLQEFFLIELGQCSNRFWVGTRLIESIWSVTKLCEEVFDTIDGF